MSYIQTVNSTLPLNSFNKVAEAVNGGKSNSVNRTESFESLFQSALNMVKETNALSNMAEEEEINFSMGYTDNLHDLMVAQQKANISLQYTFAVRNSIRDA